MSPSPELILTARQRLYERYGLANRCLSDGELSGALVASGLAGASSSRLFEPQALERLFDALPIDESSLFRHAALWSWLETQGLPPLIDRALEKGQPVRALSLGCSSGQEAFSLAILLRELYRQRGLSTQTSMPLVEILGLDASPARVERARSGQLTSWSVERTTAERLASHVQVDPRGPGLYRISPEALSLCRFEQANLLDFAEERRSTAGFDLVLLQHVLIYLDEALGLRALDGVVRGLEPHAVLIVSPTEAHLLARQSRLVCLDLVGAASPATPSRAAPVQTVPPLKIFSAPRAPAVLPPPQPVEVERQLDVALELLSQRRLSHALQAARVARKAAPTELVPRLVEARVLMAIDEPQGRRALEALLKEAAAMPKDSALPLASELTVGQLTDAARLLLEGGRR